MRNISKVQIDLSRSRFFSGPGWFDTLHAEVSDNTVDLWLDVIDSDKTDTYEIAIIQGIGEFPDDNDGGVTWKHIKTFSHINPSDGQKLITHIYFRRIE